MAKKPMKSNKPVRMYRIRVVDVAIGHKRQVALYVACGTNQHEAEVNLRLARPGAFQMGGEVSKIEEVRDGLLIALFKEDAPKRGNATKVVVSRGQS